MGRHFEDEQLVRETIVDGSTYNNPEISYELAEIRTDLTEIRSRYRLGALGNVMLKGTKKVK